MQEEDSDGSGSEEDSSGSSDEKTESGWFELSQIK